MKIITIIFAAFVLGFSFIISSGVLDLLNNRMESTIPETKNVQDFTGPGGTHQNSRQQTTEEVSAQNPTKNSEILSGTGKANPVEETP
jgi:hypothetical protein